MSIGCFGKAFLSACRRPAPLLILYVPAGPTSCLGRPEAVHDTDAIFGANVLHPWSRRRVHHALMSGALPKRELLWHMRRVAATPPYAGKLTPTWAAQVGLSGGCDRTLLSPELPARYHAARSA